MLEGNSCWLCGATAAESLVNGRMIFRLFRLLRNSTIFRCAKNQDSINTRKEGQALLAESPRKGEKP